MLAEDRKDSILQMINEDGSVKVSKLIKLFNVSIETIRRDLETLEKEGALTRVYGGAVLKKKNQQSSYLKRGEEYIEQKREIASIVMRYIEEEQAIALNNSTTNIEIAKELKKNFTKLTIITNSLIIANELARMEGYTVILAGGILDNKEYAFYGEFTESILSNFIVDKAFISVSGVSLTRGVTDYVLGEVEVMKKLMQISQESIILADSSKIDNISLIKVTDIHEVNLIITDSKLEKDVLNKYLKKGIEIVNK
ncbi:DeoR/GlpR family DNA-binding transcription regulator [Bacillus sp. X1(2014)]|uniref:DeoR/GlpR family DNA-binding transcription regulator n=1 Tax=Bacillus sp. X1(2014) TaxID=1565991 RepID=UPI0011A95AEE|nr:DeoR/GlpR family DNA-binding transcription regulator [Bacillus sp. X1(2014)]